MTADTITLPTWPPVCKVVSAAVGGARCRRVPLRALRCLVGVDVPRIETVAVLQGGVSFCHAEFPVLVHIREVTAAQAHRMLTETQEAVLRATNLLWRCNQDCSYYCFLHSLPWCRCVRASPDTDQWWNELSRSVV